MQALIEKSDSLDALACEQDLLDDILAGLRAPTKSLSPKYFYDENGSQLFEKITQLPEYYPTRTELSLLAQHATEIAQIIGHGRVLIEPGAGNCAKVRHLLPQLKPACYVPIDISHDFLFDAAKKLQAEFETLNIFPIADDMRSDIELPSAVESLPRVVFYPGSTIGNYMPDEAVAFLRHIRNVIGADGGLLIGVDLQKDTDILHRAYNDTSGITAQFNLNILRHINELTGANFNLSQFGHLAFYNDDASRIEMHLESKAEQFIAIAGEVIPLTAGERILTEYSYKYTTDSFAKMAAQAGLQVEKCWLDEERLFSLQYYRAV